MTHKIKDQIITYIALNNCAAIIKTHYPYDTGTTYTRLRKSKVTPLRSMGRYCYFIPSCERCKISTSCGSGCIIRNMFKTILNT